MSIAHDDELSVAANRGERIDIFLHSFAFVFGFGAVFTLLGSAAGLLGASLFSYQIILQKIGGVLLVIFGLATLGFFFKIAEFLQKRQLTGRNLILSLIHI